MDNDLHIKERNQFYDILVEILKEILVIAKEKGMNDLLLDIYGKVSLSFFLS